MSIKQAWCNFCCTEPVFRWTFLEEVYSPPRGGRRRIPTHSICRVYFNPRPPRGGRLLHFIICSFHLVFQSTPSAGRATNRIINLAGITIISIHALCGEGDKSRRALSYFVTISIHALCGEGDPRRCSLQVRGEEISIHALRGEGDKRVMIRFLPGSSP